MDRESFLETIRKQYSDDIHEAYVEAEHEGGAIDWGLLNEKLGKLMKSAKAEGLSPAEFCDLVQSVLPEDARSHLTFEPSKQAA